jgi:cell wall-associated NlpC family hydrolase
MKFGICNISITPLREEKSQKSEMISQLLYGETFEILELSDNWSYIKMNFDNYKGWIKNNQYVEIDQKELKGKVESRYCLDLVEFVESFDKKLKTIVMGSNVSNAGILNDKFDGNFSNDKKKKEEAVEIALSLINTPYLWGGRSPFGIDCSGFTQLAYKMIGVNLPRDAKDQAKIGSTLSFIDESQSGDLAFFNDEEDRITHVGIILKDNNIIHASGKVRIDRLDQTGIYNNGLRTHTHKLRFIKKIL